MRTQKLKPRKAVALAVPQTREACNALIAGIGVDQRELQMMEAEMNERLAQIREAYGKLADPIRSRIDDDTAAVQRYCDAHRAELTAEGKVKHHDFPAGRIDWRTTPPSVRVTGEAAVLDSLRRLGLSRFIRIAETVNRDAILNEPQAIAGVPGVVIAQRELFTVQPFEVALTEE